MGRKPTRTEESKRQYNAEYYQKYKQEHNRAYQLSGRRTYFNNMILTLTEKLNDPNLPQDKISKMNTRINDYKQKVQEIEDELKVVRSSIWESDYHKNAEYKQKPPPTRTYRKRTPEEIEAEKNRPKRKYVKKTPEEREALKNRVKRPYVKKTSGDENNSL
jgi:hypothetical protein